MTWRDSHRLLGDGEVFVAQAERLADPNPGVEHQGKQQPVPQMFACIENRLNLLGGKDFRNRSGGLQLDRPAPFAVTLGHVVQERFV